MLRVGTLLLVGVITCAVAEDVISREVTIESGRVRGYKYEEFDLFVFSNIPYATSPTGKDRFKAPLPPPVWQDTFDAVDRRIICLQFDRGAPYFVNRTRREDCLVANIYVPDTTEKNLPVVINVHGGGFQTGFGDFGTPKNFLKTKKFIHVSFNYRVGIQGFLCLGTKDVPGNAGMKDQVALLRWVNRNIAEFGGDPNEITIVGASAGSGSVDLLQLSPITKGLFKRVIPEAGANLCPWAVQIDPIENAKTFLKESQIEDVDDIEALENFYKTAPFELLTRDWFIDRKDMSLMFTPCVERDLGQEAFLLESPYDILRKGLYEKFPMLYGFADMEGSLRAELFDGWREDMNDNFSNYLPVDLQFDSKEQQAQISRAVKAFYFGDKPISDDEDSMRAIIDFQTDIFIAYGTYRSAKMQVKAGNNQIYLYEYSFVDDDDVLVPSHPNIRGAQHAAQEAIILDGVFLIQVSEDGISDKLKKVKAYMREMWTNFMTAGNPVPQGSSLPAWPPVNAEGSPHMSLGEAPELRGAVLERRMRFWDDIYDKHYRNPSPPSWESLPRTEL